MVRGRKPKPVAMHVVEGTYRKDRHGPIPDQGALFPRVVKEVVKPPAPKHLKGTSLRIFNETVDALLELGILDGSDVGIITLYADARAELSWATYKLRREGKIVTTAAGGMKPHPAVSIKNQAAIRAGKFAAELGLTPTARARLQLGGGFGPDDPDPEESDLD